MVCFRSENMLSRNISTADQNSYKYSLFKTLTDEVDMVLLYFSARLHTIYLVCSFISNIEAKALHLIRVNQQVRRDIFFV